jgi:hypothetical protein
MGKRGDGYGSEDHLRRLLDSDPARLTDPLARKARLAPSRIEWLPFPHDSRGNEREFQGIAFLPPDARKGLMDAWRKFWPQKGRKQSWDAIARSSDTWFLVEAKANQPEFCSPGTRSEGEPRKQIERSLNRTKRSLGVHRYVSWIDSYYQYANRLAILDFLRRNKVDARLVFIYFIDAHFPDDTPCPTSEADWKRLIEARRLTLGLPKKHELAPYEYDLFIEPPLPGPHVTAGRLSRRS